MFCIQKLVNGKEVESYNIFNVDDIVIMGRMIDKQHTHNLYPRLDGTCIVRFGTDGYKLTLKYNDNTTFLID